MFSRLSLLLGGREAAERMLLECSGKGAFQVETLGLLALLEIELQVQQGQQTQARDRGRDRDREGDREGDRDRGGDRDRDREGDRERDVDREGQRCGRGYGKGHKGGEKGVEKEREKEGSIEALPLPLPTIVQRLLDMRVGLEDSVRKRARLHEEAHKLVECASVEECLLLLHLSLLASTAKDASLVVALRSVNSSNTMNNSMNKVNSRVAHTRTEADRDKDRDRDIDIDIDRDRDIDIGAVCANERCVLEEDVSVNVSSFGLQSQTQSGLLRVDMRSDVNASDGNGNIINGDSGSGKGNSGNKGNGRNGNIINGDSGSGKGNSGNKGNGRNGNSGIGSVEIAYSAGLIDVGMKHPSKCWKRALDEYQVCVDASVLLE